MSTLLTAARSSSRTVSRRVSCSRSPRGGSLGDVTDGEHLVRFVLRSDRHLADLRAALPRLLADLPSARVVTANLHPEHKAVLEGDTGTIEFALPIGADPGAALVALTIAAGLTPMAQVMFQQNNYVSGGTFNLTAPVGGSTVTDAFRKISAAGIKLVLLDTREIGKIDAGLSCMSLRWQA